MLAALTLTFKERQLEQYCSVLTSNQIKAYWSCTQALQQVQRSAYATSSNSAVEWLANTNKKNKKSRNDRTGPFNNSE
jgi:hypothetical protein